MKLKIIAVVATLSMAGCAATGQSYSERASSMTEPAANSARLVIYRAGGHSQYSARSARIKVDDNTAGNVDYEGFNTFDVSAGHHTVSTDLWDDPGSCTTQIDLSGGQQYYFEIQPRAANLVAGLLGGLAGAAMESANNECGGAFSIKSVPKDAAITALTPLHLTE